jgi:ABC-type lipoprotein release transport system permease subunit
MVLVATPIGMLLAYLSISYFGNHGLQFLTVAKGLEYFGMNSIIYTKLPFSYYIGITLLTIITTIIAAIIPARRALKYKPVEAIREV